MDTPLSPGHITFDTEAAVKVEHGNRPAMAASCSIPVLFDGRDVGIRVYLALSPDSPLKGSDIATHFADAREVLVGALNFDRKAKRRRP